MTKEQMDKLRAAHHAHARAVALNDVIRECHRRAHLPGQSTDAIVIYDDIAKFALAQMEKTGD